jgi:excisionase family DNA binding protein
VLLPDPPDPLLRAADVAPLLGGVHPRTVRRYAAHGDLGHVRVGKLMLFRLSDVQAFLDRATVSPR